MAATQTGHDVVTVTFAGLAGTLLLAILAGFSDNMAKIILIIMWGFVLGWLLLHTSQLSSMVKAL
jgi:hypothetical protein